MNIELMLAEKELPDANGSWLVEPKYDGTRAALVQKNGEISIIHRSGYDRTNRYPELAGIYPYRQDIILDGEIVCLNSRGIPEFNLIQQRQTDREPLIKILKAKIPATYYVFDILALGKQDLRRKPLTERRAILEGQLRNNPDTHILITPQVQIEYGQIGEMFKTITGNGYEGIMLKRPNSTYQSGRSPDWIKMKAIVSEDFYITGYTAGKGSRARYFGALILAEKPDGEPVCKVGTGFNNLTLKMVSEILKRHALGETMQLEGEEIILVEPTYQAEVEYLSGTKKNRFPSFKRIIPPDGE